MLVLKVVTMASAKVAKVKRTTAVKEPKEDKCKEYDILTTLGKHTN